MKNNMVPFDASSVEFLITSYDPFAGVFNCVDSEFNEFRVFKCKTTGNLFMEKSV